MTQRIVGTKILAVYFLLYGALSKFSGLNLMIYLGDIRKKFKLIVSIDVTGLNTATKTRGRTTDLRSQYRLLIMKK